MRHAIAINILMVVVSCAAFGRSAAQDAERSDARGWPREIETANARITVYEPQLETFKGNHLTSRAAISVVQAGASSPVFGGLWLDADLDTDATRRTATPTNVKVMEIRFPNLDASDASEWRQVVASEFARWKLTFSLDHLLAELKLLEQRKGAALSLKAELPQIVFRQHPALLLAIDGEPSWREVSGTSYRRLANSAFFVVQEKDLGFCFLHVTPYWWIAKGPQGPWEPIDAAPTAVAELWKNEPQPQLPAGDAGDDAPARPEVIPASQPTELIWTDGVPEYAPLAGTNLLYVKNTESDVFLHIPTQHSYVLLSGRWYRTVAEQLRWEFVPADQLPLEFSRIPVGSEKQHVLACVAGTPQARDAVDNATIPQTEAVKPGPAPDLAVTYDGEPQFAEAGDVAVHYAVNSPYAVFRVYGRYYCCEDAIWYESDCAAGPWWICSWVPPSIYLIPPSCPFYYVTYCRIFSVTPAAIYCGYYPGYRGCYVWGGTVVYGTGWSYRCWSGRLWYPRPVTWGFGVRFSSSSCSWTVRLGGASTCAWAGVRRVSTYRAPTVTAGAGGWWGGVSYRRGDVGTYRNVSAVASPTTQQAPSLYARQTQRVVEPRPLPPPTTGVSGLRADRHAPPTGHRDPSPAPVPPGRRENPPTPASPPTTHENPRYETPRPPAPQDPRRTPAPREDREAPKPPPPAPREYREAPKPPVPPPPPPREHREAPQPPPPPPPREHRETPKNPPPPSPPPRENREAPRNPPPPPPRQEYRDPPRNPPPPPRDQHDPRDNSKDRSPGRR